MEVACCLALDPPKDTSTEPERRKGLRDRSNQPGLGEQRILLSSSMLPRPDFLHPEQGYRGDSPTLIHVAAIALALRTLRNSVPCLTTTKNRLSGTGLLGVLSTIVPVQFELTE
jgi:hypothetical protein